MAGELTTPWVGENLKIIELGGGSIPLFRPNMDMRKLPTVDIVCDLEEKWPIENESYDGVFGKFVIEHMSWRAIPHFAEECFRILKIGGSIMMIGPNTLEQCKEITRRNRITIEENAMIFGGQEERGWNEHKAAFSPEYTREILTKAGFDRIEIEPLPACNTDMCIKAWKGKKEVKIETKMNKLNIGSFTVMFKDWTNCDILDLNSYAAQNGFDFKRFDASKEIPYADNSVKLLIASHFLEHLTRQEGNRFLKETFRVMEPNGVIRITVPNIKQIAAVYTDGAFSEVNAGGIKTVFADNEGVKNAEDEAEALWNFLTAGHKTAYDAEALTAKLAKAGFTEVQKMESGKSRSPEIQSETKDMYPDHSIYIEAVKPAIAQPIAPATFQPPENLQKLKIGLLSTQFFGVPPKGYSGLEMVVWDLAAGLSELGHIVTLFAPEGSRVPQNGKVVFTGPPLNSVGTDWLASEQSVWNIVIHNGDGLDLLHGHDWFGFEYSAKVRPENKICHTHHGHLNPEWWCRSKPPYKLNFIGISQFMKHEYEAQGIPSEYVYNGIDLSRYPYQEKKGDYLLFVGRLDSFKQPHVAIEVAKQTGLTIHVVGGTFVNDKSYLSSIMSMASDKVIIHPDASHEEKLSLMQNARCLLFPSKMGEPFGLVAAEAMACGTPVIALNDGAIGEVVENDVTGYICANEDEMKESVSKIGQISPENYSRISLRCRQRVETLFSRRTMAENYVKLYQRILKGDEW
jgi:glycosyltransferase involved in cell wall biosynthesis/predicted SAM-dependent methyltransferase